MAVLRFFQPGRLSDTKDALLKFLIKAIKPFEEKNSAAKKPKDNNPPFLFFELMLQLFLS